MWCLFSRNYLSMVYISSKTLHSSAQCIKQLFWLSNAILLFRIQLNITWTTILLLLVNMNNYFSLHVCISFCRCVRTLKHYASSRYLISSVPNLGWPARRGVPRLQIIVQATSVLRKAFVWYEIRVLWGNINNVKSHAIALAFILQIDINQIFHLRYCMLF